MTNIPYSTLERELPATILPRCATVYNSSHLVELLSLFGEMIIPDSTKAGCWKEIHWGNIDDVVTGQKVYVQPLHLERLQIGRDVLYETEFAKEISDFLGRYNISSATVYYSPSQFGEYGSVYGIEVNEMPVEISEFSVAA